MSRSAARGGAPGTTGASSSARGAKRLARREARIAAAERYSGRGTLVSPDVIPLLPLAVAAAGLPLFVWSALGDEMVLPRLAATFWLAGCALVALSWVGAWSQLAWRRMALAGGLLAAVLLTSALSTALGTAPVRSLLGEYERYQGLLPLLMYGALMLAAMAATAYARTSRPLLIGLFAGGLLSALYGLVQWAGLDWVTWAGIPSGQIGGAFAQPEVLGIELAVAAAASTGLLPDASDRARLAVGAGIVAMLFVVFLSLSRGAFVGAGAAVAVLAVLHFDLLRSWRSKWWYALPAAVVLAGVVLAMPQGRDTLGRAWHRVGSARNFSETSISQRLGLWHLALEMTADHPVVGSGPDAFPQLFGAYRTQDQPGVHTQNVRAESSHNLFLDRLVDTGVLGLAAFLALIGACAWVGLRALRRLDAVRRAQMAALLAAAAAYYGAAFFYYGEARSGWIPWLLLGAIVGLAATAPEAAGETDSRPARVRAAAAADGPAWRPAARAAGAVLGVVLVAAGLWLALADHYSARAFNDFKSGDLVGAVGDMHTAARLNPLQPNYAEALGGYQSGVARSGQASYWADALASYRGMNDRFGGTAASLVKQAEAQANVAFTTEADKERVFALLERAVATDPNNASVRQGVADFYDSVGESGRAAPHRAWLAQAEAAGDAPKS